MNSPIDLHGMSPITRPSASRLPRRTQRQRRVAALLAVGALVLAACGESGTDATPLSGATREPPPVVDGIALPSVSQPGDEVVFRADPGELQVVYFGFTNCPDVCPTTLADLTVALRKLGEERAADVDVVMVSVDPDRDLPVLDRYIKSFVPDGVAVGTDDDELTLAAAEPFGASWEVRVLDDGTVEVDHSPFLYVVDDQGRLVLTWQFGASSDDMSSDLGVLLERAA